MANNVTLNPGSGGDVIATEDVAGVEYQYIKLVDGTASSTTAIPLSGDLTNGLDVDVTRVSGTVTVDGSGVTQPVSNTGLTSLAAAINSNKVDVNIASYSSSQTDDSAFAPGTDSVAMIGATFDDTTPDSVDEGDGGAVRMSATRNLYTTLRDAAGNERGANIDASNRLTVVADLGSTDNAVLDSVVTNTNKGASHYRNVDANAEAAIKASAGTLHWIHVMNMTASVAYLHLYDDTTGNVTPGSTTPDFTFPIPTQGDTNGAGFYARLEHAFGTAITLVCTTTIDGSTGDPGTNGVFVNAGYT